MSRRQPPDPRLSLRNLIAAELRLIRRELRLSGVEFGEIIHLDKTMISRLESGERPLQLDQAKLLDAHIASLRPRYTDNLDNVHARFEALVTLASGEPSDDWGREHERHEQRAHAIQVWESGYIPGLFQTADYARSMISATDVPMDVDKLLARRLDRQQILTRDNPPQVWALIDAGILMRPTDNPSIMRGQLAHLLELTELPNVTIRVVPQDVPLHQGLDGAFKIFKFTGALPLGYTEAAFGWRLVSDPSEVDLFALRWERLSALALPVSASKATIREHMETM